MFTGIVEAFAVVRKINREESNIRFTFECPFSHELKIDQSVAHNGVCLTVVAVSGNSYEVVAIDETLKRSNLGSLRENDRVNLERCMKLNDRIDGHIVQGHVDTTGVIGNILSENGSWLFEISYLQNDSLVTVQKGSVCVNGVSLTVVESGQNQFSVAIIPYTWENTNFSSLEKGDTVNIEFDIIGKYVAKLMR